MQVDLNKKELEILDSALQAWEKEASGNAMIGSMFAAILVKDEDRMKEVTDRQMAKAAEKDALRKTQSLLLRAKLAQAAAPESEHEVA
jgi:hypothetical protein